MMSNRGRHTAGRARAAISGAIAILSLFSALLLAEVALYAVGRTPFYTGDAELDNPIPASFWICEGGGCRFDPEESRAAGGYRLSIVNEQGYHDSDAFVYADSLRVKKRI
ncbi:MAG: hypothetical protein GF410_13555, partial [Chitinivibrionales bacterium]|nr:hypothetical protein [Chitinivibrionales bacterium]